VKRILLVEDSRDQLDLFSLALMRRGWQVEVASRASEALEHLANRRFDLVVSHLGLPDEIATHMLQKARAEGWLEKTAALIITGQANPDNPESFPVLRKPVDIEALVRQVGTILGEGPAAASVEETAEGRVELVLYYTPPWPSSEKARRNLEKILAGYAAEAVHLSLRDLAEHPDLAEADGVVFSPTLIKKSPGAPVWMLGDLSDAAAVTDMLLSAGLSPRS
jgi:DNA-binding response OmpR family regulator